MSNSSGIFFFSLSPPKLICYSVFIFVFGEIVYEKQFCLLVEQIRNFINEAVSVCFVSGYRGLPFIERKSEICHAKRRTRWKSESQVRKLIKEDPRATFFWHDEKSAFVFLFRRKRLRNFRIRLDMEEEGMAVWVASSTKSATIKPKSG